MKFEKNNKYFTIAAYSLGVICLSILFVYALFKFGTLLRIFTQFLSIISPIFIGIGIAYILNPVMDMFENKVLAFLAKKKPHKKLRRAFAIIFTSILFFAVLATILAFIIPEIIDSVVKLYESIPTYATQVTEWGQKTFANNPKVRDFVISQLDKILGYLENLTSYAVPVLSKLTNGVINFVYGIINFALGYVVAIYLLLSKELFIAQIKKSTFALFPKRFGYRLFNVTNRINNIFMGSIISKIIDSVIVGIICFLGMMIFKMPYPVLISVLIGITNIIPFFGPFIGAVPSALFILIVDPVKVIWFLLFMLVLQQFDGNFLAVKLQGDWTGISAFWALVAVLVGGGFFGVMGMILAVPVFAVFYMLFSFYIEKRLKIKKLPYKTESYYGNINDLEKIKED